MCLGLGEDGIDGKSGIDSPVVGIYLHELLGNVNLVTRVRMETVIFTFTVP